jgi:hypothetical protein
MMVRYTKYLSLLATVVAFAGADAQTPAADPSDRLREVLPADVAGRVLARIAQARARELPAAALENRALKFAAKGVKPSDIEKSVHEHAERLEKAKDAIEKGRGRPASAGEIDAGAEAVRRGVDGAQISALAKSAPSGRSLDVPFTVISSLIGRGLKSDEAILRVQEMLVARRTDRELEDLPGSVGASKRPTLTGTDLAATKRPAGVGSRPTVGPPAGVPGNAGKGASPNAPGQTKKP